ncbi:protein amnionless-like [Coccinella septempunctata]|uniref:protein amnionless-like n=1 Tax=Coccinella septempunctata TaxID=41139 RepID=UPI001D09500C|nr:protein amnionless-like [Coccinella septempunctata]
MGAIVKFYVFWLCFYRLFRENSAEEHTKVWKPDNDLFKRLNWVDPNSEENCRKVEFAPINNGQIYITKLAAVEYVLPLTGKLEFAEGGSMKVVDAGSDMKTNCLKLKPLMSHDYLDPRNWDSDVADNPAVPDREKLPCRDDHIVFRSLNTSSVDFDSLRDDHIVSRFTAGDYTSSDHEVVDVTLLARLIISERKCRNPAGCVCNDERNFICGPPKKSECMDPVFPKGFCHPICGAFTVFKPKRGFSLKKLEDALKDYSDVYTHVSKIDDDVIQLVFAEKEYSGDSAVYAEDFYEKLQEKSEEFKITDLGNLKKSGSRTTGNASLFTVLLSSLLFVCGIFGLVFCLYGDRRWLTNLRFRTPTTFPLTSTYRARFSSREDESGLIFDTQSIAGSVLNLRQSFDNPMFGDASAVKENTDEQKIDTVEEKPAEKNDPLFDLKKLNEELHEEIGSNLVKDLQESLNFSAGPDYPPLIEVEEIDED